MKQDEWNDRWLDEIRCKMDDYQEEIPADGWDRLSAALVSNTEEAPVAAAPRRRFVLPAWARMAAAAVLLAVVAGGWYSWNIQRVQQVAETLEQLPQAAEVPQILKAQAPEEPLAEAVKPAVAPVRRAVQPKAAAVTDTLYKEAPQAPDAEHEAADSQETAAAPSDSTPHRVERYRDDSPVRMAQSTPSRSVQKKRSGWTLGMSVGSGSQLPSFSKYDFLVRPGAGSLDDQLSPKPPQDDQPNQNGPEGGTESNDSILGGAETRGAGMPTRISRPGRIPGENHRTWSFGITLNKQLNEKWAVETGLVYTLLTSDVKLVQMTPQKLHYVGIPLKLNYTLTQRKGWHLYLGGGAMVERCVYAVLGDQKLNINALQFSVSANAGLQYRFTEHTGLYLEPGFRYYFDDGTYWCSFRTAHPLSVTLQTGFRISY